MEGKQKYDRTTDINRIKAGDLIRYWNEYGNKWKFCRVEKIEITYGGPIEIWGTWEDAIKKAQGNAYTDNAWINFLKTPVYMVKKQ